MKPLVILADGRQVENDDPAWLDECQVRQRHVMSMRGMDLPSRRIYLDALSRSAGAEMTLRVSEAYAEDFQRRKEKFNHLPRKEERND